MEHTTMDENIVVGADLCVCSLWANTSVRPYRMFIYEEKHSGCTDHYKKHLSTDYADFFFSSAHPHPYVRFAFEGEVMKYAENVILRASSNNPLSPHHFLLGTFCMMTGNQMGRYGRS